MRSFAPTLTEGALLSQNSIQALLKKEEEQNNSSWKNYLTLLATESIQHGGFDAYALALVLKEKFSAGTAEHLLDLLTAEGKSTATTTTTTKTKQKKKTKNLQTVPFSKKFC